MDAKAQVLSPLFEGFFERGKVVERGALLDGPSG
jgi:hypothetical protein